MRTPKQIAIDIIKGDQKARNEFEKMWNKTVEEMTETEKMLGLGCLSAFEEQWNKSITHH